MTKIHETKGLFQNPSGKIFQTEVDRELLRNKIVLDIGFLLVQSVSFMSSFLNVVCTL